MNITKETAIELAKEAGIQTYLTPLGTDEMHGRPDEIRCLCNLAIKHAAKDAEPVAYLWQHCETGRTRIVMPDDVITTDATWFVVGPLFTHPAKQVP